VPKRIANNYIRVSIGRKKFSHHPSLKMSFDINHETYNDRQQIVLYTTKRKEA